jgi:Ran GTPase-activating protein (RanGAP) involved in mRNA processing and transport
MDNQNHILDLSNQFLWNKVLCQTLKEKFTKELQFLDLSTNHVSTESANFLFSILPTSNISYLNLTDCRLSNKISIDFFNIINQCKIVELILDNNYLSPSCCTALGECLKNNQTIQSLSLKHCDINSVSCIELSKGLSNNQTILKLLLDDNSIFDPGVEALASIIDRSSLLALSVSDNQIWQESMNSLLRN